MGISVDFAPVKQDRSSRRWKVVHPRSGHALIRNITRLYAEELCSRLNAMKGFNRDFVDAADMRRINSAAVLDDVVRIARQFEKINNKNWSRLARCEVPE